MSQNKLIYFILLQLFFVVSLHSQTLSGFVFGSGHEPLAGVNVYVPGGNNGTISNSDGYYQLRLSAGEHEIVFSYIGFLNDTLRVRLKAGQVLRKSVVLQEHALQGSTIIVFAKQYNDAEEIVAQTIENKKRYLSSIQNYEYEAYQKTVIRVDTKRQKRRIGGILETKSIGYFAQPDHFQEVVLASRQSKNFSQLTNVLAVGRIPNLLEESLTFDEMRVLSPLSSKALDYYDYAMRDTTFLNNQMVFNIRFKPKNSSLPLFSGTMSIVDGVFAVIACELNGGKRIVTKLRDQIHIVQKFRSFEKKYWFPTEMRMNSRISLDIPGLPYLYWEQHALISGYKINQLRFTHLFDENQLRYRLLPKEQSQSIWEEEQTIPLDREERRAMVFIDSAVTHGSLVTKSAIWIMANFDKLLITQFYDFYHFNRVQGHYAGLGLDSRRVWENLRVQAIGGYGLSDKRPVLQVRTEMLWNRKRLKTEIGFKDRLVFADGDYRYNPGDISLQTLTRKNDYADYLYRRELQLSAEWRLSDEVRVGLTYFNRQDKRAENFAAWKKEPLPRPVFPAASGRFDLLEWHISADDLKYFDFGWLVAPDMSQDFYDFRFLYLKNLSTGSDAFERFYGYFTLFRKAPPWINFFIRLNAGKVSGKTPPQYFFHLPGAYGSFGNPVLFRSITEDRFLGDRYMVMALENNFKNTFFNLLHLPYLQHSKLDLLLFANIGWLNGTEKSSPVFNGIRIGNKPLAEAGLSIGNIFTFLRVDATWRLTYQSQRKFFFNLTSRFFVR